MSRSISRRLVEPLDTTSRDDISTTPGRLVFFQAATGMGPAKPYADMTPNDAIDVQNMRIDKHGKYVAPERQGTMSGSGGAIGVSMFTFQRSDGAFFDILATTTNFQYAVSGTTSFTVMSGTAFTDVSWGDNFSFTTWGDTVIAVNPVIGMYELDMINFIFTAMPGTPVGPMHVTSFGNRVVVTNQVHLPGRIQWSVKNDSGDWTGLGSGFEDLRVAGGDFHDIPYSVWPIDNNRALVICSRAVWLMSITGFVDAPFIFERIFDDVGTPAPYTVAGVTGGVIMMTYDDFVIVTPEKWDSIGKPVVETIWNLNVGQSEYYPTTLSANGIYVARLKEYWVGYYLFGSNTIKIAWRYNIEQHAWTRITLGFANGVIPMYYSEYMMGLAYDSVGSTFNSSSFPLETFSSATIPNWRVIFMDGTASWPLCGPSSATYTPGVITSGDIPGGDDPDAVVTITKIAVHYQCRDANPATVLIDYTIDGSPGSYDSFTTPSLTTTASQVQTFHKTIVGKNIRLVLIFSNTTEFRLIRVVVDVMRGERVNTLQA